MVVGKLHLQCINFTPEFDHLLLRGRELCFSPVHCFNKTLKLLCRRLR